LVGDVPFAVPLHGVLRRVDRLVGVVDLEPISFRETDRRQRCVHLLDGVDRAFDPSGHVAGHVGHRLQVLVIPAAFLGREARGGAARAAGGRRRAPRRAPPPPGAAGRRARGRGPAGAPAPPPPPPPPPPARPPPPPGVQDPAMAAIAATSVADTPATAALSP